MTPTKARALDAAIDLVGTEGLRALTHARVDARAGLPRGSTSNHYRTRAALLAGVVDRMVERELAQLAMASSPRSAPEFADALCGFIEHSTGANRIHTSARLALFIEASHNAPLREAISRGRAAMQSWLVPVLTRLGARHPQVAADAVAACVEGLLLHRIARHDESDPRPPLKLVIAAALAPGAGG